jgi:exopolysaccharide biosynthesis polyprenyl glycosylphosphotransferase
MMNRDQQARDEVFSSGGSHAAVALGEPAGSGHPASQTLVLAPVVPAPARTTRRPLARRLRPTLVTLDVAAAVSAALVAQVWGATGTEMPGAIDVVAVVLVGAATPVLMASLGLYRSRVCESRSRELLRVAAVAVAAALTAMAAETLDGRAVAAREAALTAVVLFVGLAVDRELFRGWLRAARARGRFSRPVLLIGRGDELAQPFAFFREHPELGYRVCGVVTDEPDSPSCPGVPRWRPVSRADVAVKEAEATGAVLVLSGLSSRDANDVVRSLRRADVHLQVFSGLTRIHPRRLRMQPLAHEPLYYVEHRPLPALQAAAKRTIDVVLAMLIFLAALPVLAGAAALIKREDGGPVLFRQRRVGRDGVPFTVLKLRTMTVDAEARRDELLDRNERQGPLFKMTSDPRVTRVGRWLRELSLDELPQLVNVIRGDMSLVGPRPALAHETEQFDDELRRRTGIRPGVTGLWQVEAQDNPSIYVYRQLDLFYVDNWSVSSDLAILARTALMILGRPGRLMLRVRGR